MVHADECTQGLQSKDLKQPEVDLELDVQHDDPPMEPFAANGAAFRRAIMRTISHKQSKIQLSNKRFRVREEWNFFCQDVQGATTIKDVLEYT